VLASLLCWASCVCDSFENGRRVFNLEMAEIALTNGGCDKSRSSYRVWPFLGNPDELSRRQQFAPNGHQLRVYKPFFHRSLSVEGGTSFSVHSKCKLKRNLRADHQVFPQTEAENPMPSVCIGRCATILPSRKPWVIFGGLAGAARGHGEVTRFVTR